MFGSSSVFLFDLTSDVDIYVGNTEIRKLYNELTNEWSSLSFVEASTPIIKGSHDGIQFDISALPNGVDKRNLLRSIFKKYPVLLPLCYLITQWARRTNIIKNSVSSSAVLTSFGLVWMFISYCKDNFQLELPHVTDIANWDSIIEAVGQIDKPLLNERPIDEILLNFFAQIPYFKVTDPIDSSKNCVGKYILVTNF